MFVVPIKNLAGLLLLFALLSTNAIAVELPPLTHSLTPMKAEEKAPSLRLMDMDEEIVDLTEMKGKVVVVNFWATWCPPCRREMGSLERLNLATNDEEVVVLAVNVGENVDTVFSFLGTVEPSPSFPMLFDTNASSMDEWKVMGLPTTYVVGPDGSIKYRAVGGREFDHPELVASVLALSVKGQ